MKNIRIAKDPPNYTNLDEYKKIFGEGSFYKRPEKQERAKSMVMLEKRVMERRLRRNRWRFKSCPRCHGDLNSCYGEDFSCFQCGYVCYSWVNNVDGRKNAL